LTDTLRGADEVRLRATEASVTHRARRRRWLRPAALLLGPVLLLLAGAYLYLSGGRYISTDDAYVRAGIVQISTDIDGRVAAVAVHEDQEVKAGDLLFRLDDRPFRYALERAQANLAQSRLHIAALRATYAQKTADIHAAEENVAYLGRVFARQQQLLAGHVASQSQFDQARHDLDAAKQALASAQQAQANVLASLGGSLATPIDQHPEVLAAKAQVDRAMLDLSHTIVRASADGIVAQVDKLQPGEYVTAGTPLFALIGTTVWVEANFKETELTHVKPGQKATVEIDTYPDHELTGTVAGISPGTGSEFSVLPAQNATGNWVKVVQRLPARIALPPKDRGVALRAGMSAYVEVDTEIRRPIIAFIEKAFAGSPNGK